jgi:hypothetical protein
MITSSITPMPRATGKNQPMGALVLRRSNSTKMNTSSKAVATNSPRAPCHTDISDQPSGAGNCRVLSFQGKKGPGYRPSQLVYAGLPLVEFRCEHILTLIALHCAVVSPLRNWIALKRRMFWAMATSVGSRSILEAPKNPTTPWVRLSTYWAFSGSAMGPP